MSGQWQLAPCPICKRTFVGREQGDDVERRLIEHMLAEHPEQASEFISTKPEEE